MRYFLSKSRTQIFSALGLRRARERSKVLGASRGRSVGSPSNLLFHVGGSAAFAKLAARMPRGRSELAQNREEEKLLCGAPKNGNAALTAKATERLERKDCTKSIVTRCAVIGQNRRVELRRFADFTLASF